MGYRMIAYLLIECMPTPVRNATGSGLVSRSTVSKVSLVLAPVKSNVPCNGFRTGLNTTVGCT
jgi:hypothetical protein